MSTMYVLESELLDDVEEAEDLTVHPEGEVKLRLKDFMTDEENSIVRENRSGKPYILPIFEIYGSGKDDMYQDFSCYIPLPVGSDLEPDAKRRRKTNASFKKFLNSFSIKLTAKLDFEKWIGKTGKGFVTIVEDDYGRKNNISEFI